MNDDLKRVNLRAVSYTHLYYVDGKRIPFSVKDLKQLNIDKVREEYQKYQEKNTDRYFKEQMEIFLQANRERYEALVEEADEYIRRVAVDYNFMEMFVSFSGGKDSTVVSDLVMRALGNPKVLHIFGDTTLEFPFTYEYVKRFKQAVSYTHLDVYKRQNLERQL